MKLLLDTHALLWWLSDNARLGQQARRAIADPANQVFVSIASLWEIVVKMRVRKLEGDIMQIRTALAGSRLGRLAIEDAHLEVLAALPLYHRDPFDHLLIAQAMKERATLISNDRVMEKYPVSVMPAETSI